MWALALERDKWVAFHRVSQEALRVSATRCFGPLLPPHIMSLFYVYLCPSLTWAPFPTVPIPCLWGAIVPLSPVTLKVMPMVVFCPREALGPVTQTCPIGLCFPGPQGSPSPGLAVALPCGRRRGLPRVCVCVCVCICVCACMSW